MGSVAKMKEPYSAAMSKDWKKMKEFYEQHEEFVTAPLTVYEDTALHIAVCSGDKKLVEFLLDELLRDDKESPIFNPYPELEGSPLQKKNAYGDTALHQAVTCEDNDKGLVIIQLLLDRDQRWREKSNHNSATDPDNELLKVKNDRGESALFRAAAFGKTNVVSYLARKVRCWDVHVRRNDSTSILHVAILGGHMGLPKTEDKAASSEDSKTGQGSSPANNPIDKAASSEDSKTGQGSSPANNPIESQGASSREKDLESGHERMLRSTQKSSQANQRTGISKAYSTFWSRAAEVMPFVKKLWDIKKRHNKVVELVEILAKKDLSWTEADSGASGREKEQENQNTMPVVHSETSTFRSESPLFAAARNGIMEIVKSILDEYPQTIEHVNDRNENIYHVAARYRRAQIFDLPHPSSIRKLSLLRQINTAEGDSVLHEAAYLSENFVRDRPGEALRMQLEIQWFKRVEEKVPPYLVNHRNKVGHTAKSLFIKQHKDLAKSGEEWLMRTAQACSLVAVLIATIAYTCSYTVPGGFDDKGYPPLLKETPFIIFTTADTLSLCFSLTSVVIFLSIMTSKTQEQDFRRSLPLKLVLGLTMLFFSVAALMVAFAATLALMMRKKLHWAAIPIYAIACCPVAIFLFMQLPLYLRISWFTAHDLVESLCDYFPCCGKFLNPRPCMR
ncbi:Ankyrin repeat-containing protein [Morus notabilis]|uniref:Ankyrin repeat-containing protein n=1 Tax=Morus notabilis TaxID=981085 RepID=W9RJS8_9ROSA|nr:Ankyrin repeat-containing protein [Morus notabilis]